MDAPGLEKFTLFEDADGWILSGRVTTFEDDEPLYAAYRVECDASWLTRAVEVSVEIGVRRVTLELRADDERRWWWGGTVLGTLDGCTDVDLGFTPATNTPPIRRLRTRERPDSLTVHAAWVSPELSVEPAWQEYTLVSDRLVQYQSAGGRPYHLSIDEDGFVASYFDPTHEQLLWEQVRRPAAGP